MRIQLSESEYAELRKLQRNMAGPSDYVKVTCILMFAYGSTPKSISDDRGIALSSLYRYVGLYKKDGMDGLLGDTYKGYWGRLDSFQISALRKELKDEVY